MTGAESTVSLLSLASIQCLGLMSAGLARLSAGSKRQQSFQRLFLACLTVVGCATVAAVAMGPAWLVTSGTVLAVMVLTAVYDAGQTQVW